MFNKEIPPLKFVVKVTWEATAEIEIEAESADEAETKIRENGLPWDKAVEGDDDHYWTEVNQ